MTVDAIDEGGTVLDSLLAYIDASPSPYHAALNAAERLQAAGSPLGRR